jgi:putative sigma-54 modulation protein
MQVQVRGKGVQVTEALRDYADKKVHKLTRPLRPSEPCHRGPANDQGTTHRVEVQLDGDNIVLRGEERGDDLYAPLIAWLTSWSGRCKSAKAASMPRTARTRIAVITTSTTTICRRDGARL